MFSRKPVTVRLKIGELQIQSLTVGDLMDFETLNAYVNDEDAPFVFHAAVNLVAKFMVDGDGNPLPNRQAIKQLRGLDATGLSEVLNQFTAAFSAYQDEASPNGRGGD